MQRTLQLKIVPKNPSKSNADIKSHRKWFEDVANSLEFKEHKDWYSVSLERIHDLGGNEILSYYDGSLSKALQTVFPEVSWSRSRFKKRSMPLPVGFWRDLRNQQQFMLEAQQKLNITKPEDWYRITSKDLKDVGGGPLLKLYGHSMSRVLKAIFPEVEWKLWKFKYRVKGFWDDARNKEDFLLDFARSHSLRTKSDWKYVTLRDLLGSGGRTLYGRYKTIGQLLANALPGVGSIGPELSVRHKREHLMFKVLRDLFPSDDVLTNFNHPDLPYSATKRRGQLDVYFPSLMIAFEYQGEHHYGHSSFIWEETSSLMKRDQQKATMCHNVGITLIPIPYWWNGSKSQMAAAIHKVRPDLLPDPETDPFSESVPQPRSVTRDTQPQHDFEVAQSKRSPACRGCRRVSKPSELMIAAKARSHKMSSFYRVYICIDPQCIQKASQVQTKACILPEFKSVVHVPSDMAKHSLPDIPGITWKNISV